MLINQVNPHISNYIATRLGNGCSTFILCGGRRSGKTFCIVQFLLMRAVYGDLINVASMTAEQGRLGAFADACTIIRESELLDNHFDIISVPREIRSRNNNGKIVFNSYQNPETAKGIACDWLFVNESNNFSKQQYTDLLANVRKGVFIDYNPNIKFWVDDFFAPDEICNTTWQDNPYLTPLQIKYFEDLKKQAERPNATAIDIRNYNVYYLGVYSELRGKIFFPNNFNFIDSIPDGLHNFCVFCDPSALRGADFFACVLSASDKDGKVYIIDTYSTNLGNRDIVINRLKRWCVSFDEVKIYAESNGEIGIDFIEYCHKNDFHILPYFSKKNKFERIISNYQNFLDNMVIVNHPDMVEFLNQVYDFDERCEHDDNVDALSSSYDLQMYTH